jgi:hypothetical protein
MSRNKLVPGNEAWRTARLHGVVYRSALLHVDERWNS